MAPLIGAICGIICGSILVYVIISLIERHDHKHRRKWARDSADQMARWYAAGNFELHDAWETKPDEPPPGQG